MINLLPDDKKKEIRAGRANVILLNYIIMSLVATGLVGLIVAGAYVTQGVTRANAQARVDIDDITFALTHFLAVLIKYQTMQVDILERDITGDFETEHDHAGHPLVKDVSSGLHDVDRIVLGQLPSC